MCATLYYWFYIIEPKFKSQVFEQFLRLTFFIFIFTRFILFIHLQTQLIRCGQERDTDRSERESVCVCERERERLIWSFICICRNAPHSLSCLSLCLSAVSLFVRQVLCSLFEEFRRLWTSGTSDDGGERVSSKTHTHTHTHTHSFWKRSWIRLLYLSMVISKRNYKLKSP